MVRKPGGGGFEQQVSGACARDFGEEVNIHGNREVEKSVECCRRSIPSPASRTSTGAGGFNEYGRTCALRVVTEQQMRAQVRAAQRVEKGCAGESAYQPSVASMLSVGADGS